MSSFACAAIILAVMVAAFGSDTAHATHAHAASSGRPCITCHVRPQGGGGVTSTGLQFREDGYTFDTDDEEDEPEEEEDRSERPPRREEEPYTPPPPETPEQRARRARNLAAAEAQMEEANRRRRNEAIEEALQLGRNVFTTATRRLSRSNQSCSSCHQRDELAQQAARYPTYHRRLGRVVNLDAAIRYCILNSMDGPKLQPNSRVSVALELFLREGTRH